MKSILDNISLENINIEEFEKLLYSYYLEIFPKDERKSLELIKSSFNKGYTKIIKITNNTNLIGFMLLNRIKEKEYAVLDYLAILPEYRDRGFGTKALKLLIEKESKNKGIFVEIEKTGLGKSKKDNILREKRQKFYEELGFKKLRFDLILFDVIYMPYIYSNIDIEEDIIINEVFEIYKAISGKERIKQNCKILKEGIIDY